jgi:23S rRNA (guanosine2251-2'-O)-methyltransferase
MTRRASVTSEVGGEQVEGRRAVRELLTAGVRPVHTLYLASDGTDDIERLALDAGVVIRRLNRAQLAERARTASPQGAIAFADPLAMAELDDLLARPHALLVALDGVTDPQNLGAVMRAAEAAGATGVVLPRHRSARVTPAAAKAAAGAIEHLPVSVVAGVPAALERAERAGVWTVGLDANGDTSLFEVTVAEQSVLIVLGAEGRGLSRLARARCDVLARIPMHGAIPSLNVAAAATLACYEVARHRQ